MSHILNDQSFELNYFTKLSITTYLFYFNTYIRMLLITLLLPTAFIIAIAIDYSQHTVVYYSYGDIYMMIIAHCILSILYIDKRVLCSSVLFLLGLLVKYRQGGPAQKVVLRCKIIFQRNW